MAEAGSRETRTGARGGAYLIGVDLGTQGTKTALYTVDGVLCAEAFLDSSLVTPTPGQAEEDADTRYAAALRTIREVVERSGVAPQDVQAIGLDGQMAGIMGIDEAYNAVTPYDSWLDTRCEKYMDRLRGGGGSGGSGSESSESSGSGSGERAFIRLTGCPVTYAHGPKVLWWKHERPEAYARIAKFVTMSAYIAGKLTGLAARDAYIDYTQLHFAGFGDILALKWSDAALSEYGVDASKLPRIVPPWEVVGRLKADQAGLCGLAEGIPVVAGCGDQPATSLGAGVHEVGDAFDVSGTASLFACCTDEYLPDVRRKTLIFSRALVPGRWLPLAYINGGGLSMRWFKELCCEGGGAADYAALEREAEVLGPGSGDLMFVPHFQGRVCPNDPNVRGSFAGLNWVHRRGHMFRAVMESIGYEYSLYADILRGLNQKLPIDRVVVIGGGAKSRVFGKIKADILGLPYYPPARQDAPTLGCVLNAGYGVGIYRDIADAARRRIRFSDPILPDPEATRAYEKYRRLYPELLSSLGGLYRQLLTKAN
ncbi:MAG: hypothetical protein LBU58_08340 [Clostridiales bacterium]|jgi:xylulokinase|nr:hypothetical protein [Clostridiales bacterium]